MIFKFFTQIRHCYKQPATKLSLRRGFHNAFGKHLLFTNTWTSGVLMFVGDVVEQEIEIQRNLMDEFDWGRFGRMFLTGLLFGPVHHYFYMWMNRKLPHRSVPVVFKKILLDQFIMSPICIILFFYTIGALEGKPTKEVTKEMKDKFVNVYVVDWCIWSPTQFINFYYLPIKFQVLYVNAVTMVYNVFLSYIKHKNLEVTENQI